MAKSDTFEKFKIFKVLLMEKITLRCWKLIGVESFYPTNQHLLWVEWHIETIDDNRNATSKWCGGTFGKGQKHDNGN
jgi:hypothetical protein